MTIYDNNLKNLLQIQIWHEAAVNQALPLTVYMNDDLGLTLTYFAHQGQIWSPRIYYSEIGRKSLNGKTYNK